MDSPPDIYRSIVEGSTGAALCFLSPDGVIQSWNPGARQLFGYLPEEAIGQPASVLAQLQARPTQSMGY